MENRGMQRTGKQLMYFTDREAMLKCTDDVIKILLPVSSKYCAHNLNFVNCFLNNTPPKEQKFILHWGGCRNQLKGFRQDVFEIITVQLTKDGGEREVNYLIPAPVLFEILGLPTTLFSDYDEDMARRYSMESYKSLALDRMSAYNLILQEYCQNNGIEFHDLEGAVKKRSSYMKAMRL